MSEAINILLADDDPDDCFLFKEALGEIPLNTTFTNVHDGQQLMKLLKNEAADNFDVLFLDLNMPRKNGLTCLGEIKNDKKLEGIPVIIFSTSSDRNILNQLYETGARHYICKPDSFLQLKSLIQQALIHLNEAPAKEKFFINP